MTRNVRFTPEQRQAIATAAHDRYTAGETWAQIAVDYDVHPQYLARLVRTYAPVTYRRWGSAPIADVNDVARRRAEGQTIDAIARDLECSPTAVRTAIEQLHGTPETRYPKLSSRRLPTDAEIHHLQGLYEACPQAPRARPGHRFIRGDEGRALALACRTLVDDGIPMGTLSRAMGRGATWLHWLLTVHDLRPDHHAGSSTSRRTRDLVAPQQTPTERR